MAEKVQRVKRISRISYTAQLLSLEVGKDAHFRIIGSAYTNFYNAKWRLEKNGKARFNMTKVDDKTLKITRIN